MPQFMGTFCPSAAPKLHVVVFTDLFWCRRRPLPSQIGNAATADLEAQRDQLLNAQGKVHEIRSIATTARQHLRELSWAEFRHKAILVGIILAEMVAIILVVYFRFIERGNERRR